MQCFIVEDGVERGAERKADLEDLFPIIEKDRLLFQSFLRKYCQRIGFSAALAQLPNEMKEKVYRNVSSRAGAILRKRVSKAETEFEEKYIQEKKAKLIDLIGESTKNRIEYPKHFIWKESPTPLETFIQRVEEACESGELDMVYETGEITHEAIQTAFQKYLNDLPKIKHLNICGADLPAAALLFEAGTIEELEINYECDGEWPPFLEQCQSLLALNLFSMEELSELPSWIRNASSLHSLDIWYTGIESLPDWIGDLQSLTQLTLYENENLKILPDSIGNLKNLSSLSLYNTLIEKFPDEIGDLQSLTTLSLCGSKNMETVPDSIGSLTNLDFLGLEDMPIKNLPDSLRNRKNLKKLCLDNSTIEKLPDWIGDLQSLTTLSLKNCRNLKTLPDSIGNLKNLVTLDLSYSHIEKLPDTIVNCTALESVNVVETKISSVPNSVSSVTKFTKDLIELIPQDESVSYHCFCNSYYKIVETIFRYHDKAIAKREGLLSLEDDIGFLVDGFFRTGMQMVTDGEDADKIRFILSIRLEREHDYYRKKLMEVAMEGILCLQASDLSTPIAELAFIMASLVDIKNNPLDAACEKYLSGDIEAFSHIDFKAAMLPEEEREEIRFIKRAMNLLEISQKEGLLALEKHLDKEAVADRDIFDYGLSLLIDGWDGNVVDKIIDNLIERETDPVRIKLAKAKDAATTAIFRNFSPRDLFRILYAYFDESITQGLDY